MPPQKPGKSFQSYGTPDDFLLAVIRRFGRISFDLAASEDNKVCGDFYSEKDNSLKQPWPNTGNLWLNPPYSDIEPWAAKAADCCMSSEFTTGRVLMLIPASIGSSWYRNHVEPYAYVFALNPRLTFKGCTSPYPKDCVLAVYDRACFKGFSTWKWK